MLAAQEPAHLVPALADELARSRKPDPVYSSQAARVSAAGGSPNSSDAIVPPERTTRASSRERCAGVVDVAQQVRDGQRVEGAILKRQLLGAALD